MKFCRSTLFEACSTLFIKPWVYIRGKQAWFWQLNPYFNSFRRIWRTYGRTYDKCLAKPLRSLLQLEILGVYMRRINYDLATVKISVFIEQRNIPFQNDISLQNHEIGSLDVKSWRSCFKVLEYGIHYQATSKMPRLLVYSSVWSNHF